MGDLNKLFGQLKIEVEAQLGHQVYSRSLKRGWGLYVTKEFRGNFAFVRTRVISDSLFSRCTLPHLRVHVKKDRADRAGVTAEAIEPKGHWEEPEARWCVPESDHEKLVEVAKYLARVYRVVAARLKT